MAQAIRSAFWLSSGVYLIVAAYLRYLHPSADPLAGNGAQNILTAVMGALLIYGACDIFRRRNRPERTHSGAISPRSAMWMWLLGAALLVFGMFWPLVWRMSFGLFGRIAVLAYLLLEAREAYLRQDPTPAVRDLNSNLDTAESDIGLKIMAAIVIAFGLAVIGGGIWYASSEWSKVNRWPRTSAVLVDKKFSAVGARLIFEYEVAGGRSAGRADRWGREEEMRDYLEPYRPGNIYPIGYNSQDASEVEIHLGYNWDLFRLPIAIVIFGALFAAAGVVLGMPWRKAPRP